MFGTDTTRRDFLKTASAATLGALAAGAPRVIHGADPADKPDASADTLIVLWMAGGMAHTETFDPKRYTPFTKGMKAADVTSTFPAIDTAVDHIKLTQHLERIASVMDRGTLIRSHVVGDLGHILHSRHQYHWHTGYEPPLTVAAPHIGAWLAHALGPNNEAIPPFIDIGQPYEGNGEAEELKAFQTAGVLGSEYGPFRIPEPAQAVEAVRPPAGMSRKRFRARYDAYRKMLEASPVAQHGSDYQRESLLRSLNNAYKLLDSPAAKAFDLSLEPQASYDTYNTGRFGLGCLLARRLAEAGARYIEVSSEYIPFKWWETHDNGHTRLADLKHMIDAPIAQLVRDLYGIGAAPGGIFADLRRLRSRPRTENRMEERLGGHHGTLQVVGLKRFLDPADDFRLLFISKAFCRNHIGIVTAPVAYPDVGIVTNHFLKGHRLAHRRVEYRPTGVGGRPLRARNEILPPLIWRVGAAAGLHQLFHQGFLVVSCDWLHPFDVLPKSHDRP